MFCCFGFVEITARDVELLLAVAVQWGVDSALVAEANRSAGRTTHLCYKARGFAHKE